MLINTLTKGYRRKTQTLFLIYSFILYLTPFFFLPPFLLFGAALLLPRSAPLSEVLSRPTSGTDAEPFIKIGKRLQQANIIQQLKKIVCFCLRTDL